MNDINPADLAVLDQMVAAAGSDVDRFVAEARQRIANDGPEVTSGAMVARLDEASSGEAWYLAAWAAQAIVRLAQIEVDR